MMMMMMATTTANAMLMMMTVVVMDGGRRRRRRRFHGIINNEVDFPEDLSQAAISLVSKVSVIAIKCYNLLYALKCNLSYLVLNLQELDHFPQSCMCCVQFIK